MSTARAKRVDAVDRRVGWMVALGSSAILVTSIPAMVTQGPVNSPVWQVATGLIVVLCVVLTGFGLWLPMWLVRSAWRTIPVICIVVVFCWPFVSETAPSDGAIEPWVWLFEPAAVGFATIAWRWQIAVGYSLAAAATLPMAYLIAAGAIPENIELRSFIHVGNIAFVAFFVLFRRQLTELWRAERAEAERAESLARTQAAALEQEWLAAIVHDEVLATLGVAMHQKGKVSSTLAEQADRALAVMRSRTDSATQQTMIDSAGLVAAVKVAAFGIDQNVVVTSSVVATTLPAAMVSAMVSAVAEAIRNSLKHNLDTTIDRSVRIDVVHDEVVIIVRDSGQGFDVATLDPTRLGVRGSILARMRAIPGGAATIVSSKEHGTRVALRWVRDVVVEPL